MLFTPSHEPVFHFFERVALVLIGTLALVLGYVGFTEYFALKKDVVSYSDIAYQSVNLFFMEMDVEGKLPLTLDVARWLAPLTLSYAVVKTLLVLLRQQVQRYRLKFLRDHIVIVGLNGFTVRTAEGFLHDGKSVVVIDENEHHPFWSTLQRVGAFCIVGSGEDDTLLQRVNVVNASHVLLCTDQDAHNLQLTQQAYEIAAQRHHLDVLKSVTWIRDSALRRALYNRPLFAVNHPKFTSRIFDYDKLIARWLMNHFSVDLLQLPNRLPAKPKVVLLGDTDIIDALALRYAELGLYTSSGQLQIQVIRLGTNQGAKELDNTFVCEEWVDWQQTKLEGLDWRRLRQIDGLDRAEAIYVCMTQTDSTLLATQSLLDIGVTCPIVVTQTREQKSFAWFVEQFRHLDHLHIASIYDELASADNVFGRQLDQFAQGIHERYLQEQTQHGDSLSTNSSLLDWDALPEVLKDANRNQADHALLKARLLTGLAYPDPEQVKNAIQQQGAVWEMAQVEHRRWLAEKLLDGWQYTDGPKDASKRLSPSIKPWSQLSEEDKQKDVDTVYQLPELVALHNTECRRN